LITQSAQSELIFAQFAYAIGRAQAEARVSAEVKFKKIDPQW
jgi:hypothetical protein